MYAIVEIGGRQFKVQPEERYRVPNLEAPVGQKVKLDRVILVADGSQVTLGTPFVQGGYVEAEVLAHGKDRKVIVFKKKRRKNYRRKKGHRQLFTEILVKGIEAPAAGEKGS